MADAYLEHVNVTVTDPKAVATLLCGLFDWKIRWEGDAISGGYSLHVGNDTSYIVLYSRGGTFKAPNRYSTPGALNHIGIVVSDIAETEKRVRAAGFDPYNFGEYEPGKRFYFDGPDSIEIEVVTYH